MASGQGTISQLDFSLGIVRDVSPNQIDPRACFDHLNGLYDRRGAPFKRGGTEDYSTGAHGSSGLTWIDDREFAAGQRTIFANGSDFAVLADDKSVVNLGSDGMTVPKASALIEDMLFIGGGHIYSGSRMTAAYSTGTVTLTNGSKTVTGSGTTWNTLVDKGMLLQRGDERVYPIASIDSTTQITLRDNYEGVTGSGITYALNPIYKIRAADPYEIANAYTVCANRLVVVADEIVKFSEIKRPHIWSATINAIPIPNEHSLPEGAEGIGVATVGLTVLAFTTAGTWTVDGLAFDIVDPNGNPQHTVQLLSREMVLWSGAGVAYWQQAAIIPLLDGIYFMGTGGPERISGPIDDLYRAHVDAGYQPGQAEVDNGHYLLPILSASGAAVRDNLVCRLDRKVNSDGRQIFPWSRLSESGGEIAAYRTHIGDPGEEPLLLGAARGTDSKVVNCTPYFNPDAAHSRDADDSVFTWVLVTRDYETGNLTKNMVRNARIRAQLQDADDDDPTRITVEVGEGLREEGGPYYMDLYDFAVEVGDDPDDLYFAPEDDDVYTGLEGKILDNPGIDPKRFRVGPPSRRYVRLRLNSTRPAATLVLRSIELRIRPSEAVRR